MLRLPQAPSVRLDGSTADIDERPVPRVLVPVTSLEPSRGALGAAVRLVRSGGGRLRLVHVRTWDRPPPGGRWGRPLFLEASEESTLALDHALRRVWASGIEASGVVVEVEATRIGTALVREASQWSADLVVVDRPRRGVVPAGVWERAGRQVLRSSPCPVLVVGPRPVTQSPAVGCAP